MWEVVSPLKDYIRVRTVEQVPVGRATNGIVDDNYLKTSLDCIQIFLKDLKTEK